MVKLVFTKRASWSKIFRTISWRLLATCSQRYVEYLRDSHLCRVVGVWSHMAC